MFFFGLFFLQIYDNLPTMILVIIQEQKFKCLSDIQYSQVLSLSLALIHVKQICYSSAVKFTCGIFDIIPKF